MLCRLLITQLYFYQTQIESYLSDSLSTFVTAQEARGVWDTLYPVIELEYLRVGPDQVNPGLEADFVRAVPDYLQSIRLQTAIWEELSIVDLSIDLNQRADGSWTIGAFPTSTGAGAATAGQKLADMLLRSRSINIQNLSLNYFFEDGRNFNMNFPEVLAENDSDFHRISLKGQVDGEENGIEAELELRGSDYQFRNMQGQGYVALSGADMSNLFSALLEGFVDDSNDTPIFAEGEMWFEIEEDSQIQMFGDLLVSDVDALAFDGSLSFGSKLWGTRTKEGDWRLDLVDLDMTLAEQRLDLMGLSMQTQGGGIRILSESVGLDDLVERLLNLEFVSEDLRQILTTLEPRGDLAAASLSLLDTAEGYNWFVDGNLQAAYFQSYSGAPRIENLNAYFRVDQDGGEVLIDSVDTGVHFDRLFAQKMFNRELQGQVGWKLKRENGELHVYSNAISSTNEYGAEGVSQFHLVTPISRGGFASDFTLITGLKNGSADLWPLYLPTNVNDSLVQWFGESGISGELPEVGFIYRGKIRSGSEYPKTYQLMGDLDEGELQFASGWPQIEELNSRFGLSDRKFYNYSPISQLQDVTLVNSKVEIRISEESQLISSALLVGDLNNILDLARQTPGRSSVGNSLDELQFSGHAEVSFGLEQPIALNVPSDQIYVDIQTNLSNVDLQIESLDIGINSISGALSFDEDGLRSDGFSARLWDKELQGAISSDRSGSMQIQFNSEIDVDELTTRIDDPLVSNLKGSIQFESELNIHSDAEATQFWLRSDSLGVSTDLPQPLSKAAEVSRPFELMVSLSQDQGSAVDIHWGDALDLSLDLDRDNQLISGAFGLSGARPEKEIGKFVGNVVFEKFDYLEWQSLIKGAGDTESTLAPQIDISSQETWFSGMDIGASRSRVLLYEGDVEVGFSTDFGEGRFVLDQSNVGNPHRLTFNWLDIAEFPGVSKYGEENNQMVATADPEQDSADDANTNFDPRKFPAMVLDLVELRYGDSDLGQWFFEIEPHALGLSVSNIQSRVAGSEITADSMSRLEWGYNGSEHITEIDLQMNLEDVGEIFEQVGKPAAVSSENGMIDAHLGWLGVPWQPSLEQLTGTVDVALDDGKFDAEAEGDDLLKLIALFSIDNWGRRLKFDFSDITDEGTGYRSFRGNFGVENGLVTTLSPVQINLITGSLKFSGEMNLSENQVDAELIATLPVRNNLAWVTAAFMGIPAAAGVWLFGELFKDELDSMASVTYLVTGDLDAPDIDAKSAVDAESSSTESAETGSP